MQRCATLWIQARRQVELNETRQMTRETQALASTTKQVDPEVLNVRISEVSEEPVKKATASWNSNRVRWTSRALLVELVVDWVTLRLLLKACKKWKEPSIRWWKKPSKLHQANQIQWLQLKREILHFRMLLLKPFPKRKSLSKEQFQARLAQKTTLWETHRNRKPSKVRNQQ